MTAITVSEAFTNVYFLINVLSGIVLIFAYIVIIWRAQNSTIVGWLKVFIAAVILVIIQTMGVYFVKSQSSFQTVQSLIPIYIAMIGVSFVGFGVSYIGKSYWMRNPIVLLMVWIPAILIVYFGLRTSLLFEYDFSKTEYKDWGYVITQNARLQYLPIIWTSFCLSIPIVLIIRYYQKLKDEIQKKQTRLVVIGLGIPFIIGLGGSGILPLFGINPPSTTGLASVILSVVVGFAIILYGSTLDPGAITEDIVKNMSSPALAINASNNIVFFNTSASNFFSTSKQELMNKSILDIFSPDKRDLISQYIEDIKKADKGSNNTIDTSVQNLSGDFVAVSIYGSCKIDEKTGKVIGVVLLFADIQRLQDLLKKQEQLSHELLNEKAGVEQKVISRTKQLHEEQAKLRASIEGLNVGFILVDINDNILVQNKTIQKIFNFKQPAKSINDFTDAFEDGANINEKRKINNANGTPLIVDNMTYGSKVLHIFFGPVSLLEDGVSKMIGTIALVEDITEEKVLQRSRDEFFSIASHELRTPLTAIKGNTSLIMQYYSEQLKDPELKEMVEDIHNSSVRLIDIVNDFLDVSRLEQGKVVFVYETVKLDEIIESVVYEMATVLNDKKIYLKFDKMTLNSLPTVRADKNRLKQIVYNLVGNAAKFTETGGINITAQKDGDMVKVLVIDTGKGMSEENQRMLFHKFQQANDNPLTRDATRGTGLGLYISRMLAEKMGGHIQLEESQEGKGSTFSFTVPISEEHKLLASKVEDN